MKANPVIAGLTMADNVLVKTQAWSDQWLYLCLADCRRGGLTTVAMVLSGRLRTGRFPVKRLLFTLIACILGLTGFGDPAARADGIVDAVTVRIKPTTSSLTLGEGLDLRISVNNNGAQPSPPLVIHLRHHRPGDRSTSVEAKVSPATLLKKPSVSSRQMTPSPRLEHPTHQQRHLRRLDVVALSPGIDDLATSNVIQVAVADQRTLNPGGILFVAIGAPALVGALLLLQLRLARRTRSRPDARAGHSQ